jgi:hypothetical protein
MAGYQQRPKFPVSGGVQLGGPHIFFFTLLLLLQLA